MLLGYIRSHLLMTDSELVDLKERLAYFARTEGYTLGTVYVEQVDGVPAAFDALLEAIRRDDVKAVVVPGLHHLAVLGAPASMKDQLEHRTGAQVLVAAASA